MPSTISARQSTLASRMQAASSLASSMLNSAVMPMCICSQATYSCRAFSFSRWIDGSTGGICPSGTSTTIASEKISSLSLTFPSWQVS